VGFEPFSLLGGSMNIHEAFQKAKQGKTVVAIEGDALNVLLKEGNQVFIYYFSPKFNDGYVVKNIDKDLKRLIEKQLTWFIIPL